jgi:hypothetical protein
MAKRPDFRRIALPDIRAAVSANSLIDAMVAEDVRFLQAVGETKMEKLFSYAVILHPTPEQLKEGKRSQIVVEPTKPALFRSESEVHMVATQAIPSEHMEHADRLEVAVSPF